MEEKHPNKPPEPVTKQKRKGRKVRRFLVITAISVAAVFLVVIPLLVNFYADVIVGQALKEIIKIETNNTYQIEFGHVGFNLFKREIDFREIHLYNDTTFTLTDSLPAADSSKQHLYLDLSIPHFNLKLATIYRAVLHEELIIERFTLQNPDIRLWNALPEPATFSEDSVFREKFQLTHLYSHIQNYFTLLKIGRFSIGEANLLLMNVKDNRADTLRVSNFSLKITGFHLDSLAHLRHDRLYFSDSISLRLRDGKFRYRGKLQEVTFDHFEVSSYDEVFSLKNVRVLQDSLPNSGGRGNFFSLRIPEIKMKALDVRAVLDSGALLAGEVHLINPEIHLPTHSSRQKAPNTADISQRIFEAASAVFYPLKVDELRISSGSLHLPDTSTTFSVPDFDLAIFGVFIDSATYAERSPLFFADDLVFRNRNQRINTGLNGWSIDYKNLLLDTRSNALKIDDLTTYSPADDDHLKLNCSIPAIEALGEDFKGDFLRHTLSLNSIAISGAKWEVELRRPSGSPPDDSLALSLYNLYPLIRPVLQRVSASRLRMDAAELNLLIENGGWETLDIKTNFDITLDDFRIDEYAPEEAKILYAEGHRILLSRFSAEMPFIEQNIFFDEATLNTGLSTLKIDNISIDRAAIGKTGSLLPVFVEGRGNLNFSGVDFDGLYFGRGLFVDSVKLLQSDVEIFRNDNYRRHALHKSTRKPVPYFFGDLQVSDGRIKVCDVAGLPLVEAEIARLWLAEISPGNASNHGQPQIVNLETGLRNVYFVLPDSVSHGHIQKLEASSLQSEAIVQNFTFSHAGVEEYDSRYDLEIPELSLQDFPFLDIYHHQKFSAGDILLRQPGLVISTSPDTAFLNAAGKKRKTFKHFDTDILKTKIAALFPSFQFDSLQVIDGSLRSHSIKGFPLNNLMITGMDFAVGQFSVDPATTMHAGNIFFARSIALQADNATFYLSENDSLLINQIVVSTAKKQLTLGEVIQNQSDYQFAMNGFAVDGLDFYELVKKKHFIADKIRASRPKISIYPSQQNAGKTNKPLAVDDINLYHVFSEHLFSAAANDLTIDNAALRIDDTTTHSDNNWYFGDVNLRLKNISIDSTNKIFNDKIFYADDLEVSIRNFSETTSTGRYDFGASLISYTADEAQFVVENGYLTPNYPEDKFAQLSGVQTDRLAFQFERFCMSNFNLKDFLLSNRLHVDKVEVDDFKGDDFRDKSYPFPQHHYPPLPVTALRNVDIPLSIDTLLLRNARMTYREYVPPALQPGKIFFTNLNLAGRNITNDSAEIARDSLMRFYISSRLMDKGKMEVQLDFDLKSKTDNFRANGVVNAFDLTSLNPILEHVAFVRINSGENELLEFNFLANNEKANGTLRFTYNKLQIRLIDKENLEEGGGGDGFTSFLANTFVVRRNNPKFLGRLRKGEIYFTRDINKSFFNFLAKSALSGISSTIRGGSEERREKRQLRRLKKQQDQESSN